MRQNKVYCEKEGRKGGGGSRDVITPQSARPRENPREGNTVGRRIHIQRGLPAIPVTSPVANRATQTQT